jgi:hypothetical protein
VTQQTEERTNGRINRRETNRRGDQRKKRQTE